MFCIIRKICVRKKTFKIHKARMDLCALNASSYHLNILFILNKSGAGNLQAISPLIESLKDLRTPLCTLFKLYLPCISCRLSVLFQPDIQYNAFRGQYIPQDYLNAA